MGITGRTSSVESSPSLYHRFQQSWHRWVLNRCVLRPTRHHLDPVQQIRCQLTGDGPSFSPLDCFVHPDPVWKCQHVDRSDVSQRDGWTLSDFGDVPRPDVLVLKFPGTAGRAERSTAAPADWLTTPTKTWSVAASATKPPTTEVWTWNPPGYGKSPGKACLSGYVPAAERFARLVVQSRAREDSMVWLVGNSLGCLPALALGSRPTWSDGHHVGLWLRNPPDLATVVRRIARRWYAERWMTRVTDRLPAELRSLETASECRFPAVFLMSELDTLVPPDVQKTVQDAYAGDKKVVPLPGIGHDGLLDDRHLDNVAAAAAWLHQTLSTR